MASRFQVEWGDERIAKLKELFEQKVPIKQIADQLGCTKNAVIGKAHRLGLRGTRRPPAPRQEKQPRPKRATHMEEQAIMRNIEAIEPTPEIEVPLITPAEPTDSVSLIDLMHWHCRAPVPQNFGPIRYCGKIKANGSSYCPEHRALFTQAGGVRR